MEYYNSKFDNKTLGIFLYGSQNYKINDEKSDVDSRIITLKPIQGKDYISLDAPTTNEHIEVLSLDLYSFQLRNMNLSALETFFTNYYLSSSFEKQWEKLRLLREDCARLNEELWLKNFLLEVEISKQRFLKQISFDADVIKELGFTPKGVYHVVRYEEMLTKYIQKKPYEEVLVSDNSTFLKEIKRGKYSQSDCKVILEEYYKRIQEKATKANLKFIDYSTNYKIYQEFIKIKREG